MRTPRALLLATLPLLFLAPARAEDGLVETWDRIHMAGGYAGYSRSTVRRTSDAIESASESVISMKRMGQGAEIRTSSATWESSEGALAKIEQTSKMSAQETRSVFTFSAGKVEIETTVMGQTRKVEMPVPEGLVGPVRATALTRALWDTSGKTVEYLTYMADFQGAVKAVTTSKGREDVTMHDGSKRSLTRVEAKLAMANGAPIPMSPVAWIDEHGEPIRTEVRMAGLLIESFRVADKAAATAEDPKAKPAPDLFAETLIKEDGPIPVARRLEAAVIEVRPRTKGAVLPAFADAGHVVTEREDGSVSIRATRRVPPTGREGERPLKSPPAELADFLAPSSMIQSDAPEVAAIVKEAVGAETNAWKAAQALERWVFESITKKNMNVAFATALEVCKSREGDCTEHAVLLAALCRAAGIPSRVVMGVEYLLGIWGGHAWNEVWIEGEWYPLDSTNGLGFVDPLHLPMARMSMKEGAGAEFVQVLGGLGEIHVDVVEVTRDGRKIAVDDPALVKTAGDLHTDGVLGISYCAPAGWKFDPPPARGPATKVMEIDGKTASGQTVEIEIGMMDAPPRLDWAKLFAEFRVDPAAARPAKLDGRDARRIDRSRDGRSEVRVVAEVDGALWMLTLDRAESEAEVAAFDAFLGSIDFDVK